MFIPRHKKILVLNQYKMFNNNLNTIFEIIIDEIYLEKQLILYSHSQ